MRLPNLTRRTFLKSTAATTALTTLKLPAEQKEQAWPENGTLIPDTGWHLQLDPQAEWMNDLIHLPNEFALKDLPTNPPTGGWQTLTPASSIAITLPTTVEQHFWGANIPGVQNRRRLIRRRRRLIRRRLTRCRARQWCRRRMRGHLRWGIRHRRTRRIISHMGARAATGHFSNIGRRI